MPYSCDFTKKSAVAHLRDCLKLQNNIACLNVLRDNIVAVGERHLDHAIPASRQKRALEAIKEELKELYPDVFLDEDSEKRIYIAANIVMRNHRSKRQDLRKKENKVGQSPHREQAGIPASKPVSKKHRTSGPLSSKQNSDEHINQALVDATQHAIDKPYDERRKIPDVRRSSLASAPGCYQQDENHAPMHATAKASDTRSPNIIPYIGRSPSTPVQVSDRQDEGGQAPMLVTDKISDNKKITKIFNTRRSPPLSMQGFDEHDEDHVPLDVTMHERDTVSGKKTKKIPDIRRSLSTPSQDEQHENQVPMDVRSHVTDKASGKTRTKEIFDSRRSSSIPTHEQDEDQAPMNLTMHTMDKISDRRKAKMSLSERMGLSRTSIANMPSAPNMFGSPSHRVHAFQPSGGVSTPFSQPRRRVLFAPYISKSQSQPDKTSQPRNTIDDPCSSMSMSHPTTHPTPAGVPSDLSTSRDSPEDSTMHGPAVSQGDKFTSVHHFLEACVPSMSYLLPRFVDYGCTHEGFLLAVSMWPPERIKKFLEDVVTSPDGQLILPMEQMVLENHLARYFKA